MKLTIAERLALYSILPKEGDFTTLIALRKLREAVSISEKEQKEFGFKIDSKGVATWKLGHIATTTDIPIGSVMKNLIKDNLKKLDDIKKLSDNHISIYEKFVLNKIEKKEKAKEEVKVGGKK